MPDNELAYLAHLQGIIDSVDELSILEVTRHPDAYHFRLAPSLPKYNQMLLEEILKRRHYSWWFRRSFKCYKS